MKTYSLYLISILSLSSSSLAGTVPNQQHPFMNVHYTNDDESTPKIHGKFLHLTDIHMDKHYNVKATISSDCHRLPEKHKKKKERAGLLAGYWGAPNNDCDSPRRLVTHSIEYIANEWKDKIDFIIWTGDNARHDGDAYVPRTKKEIIGYNIRVSSLLKEAFRLDNNRLLPIVPCLGNNDVHPHNSLRGMKNNPQLLEYSGIWSDFIPEDQIKSFQRGGYFAIDVAPGIRVLSLNTLYFFGSNDLVNTCSDKESAGHRHVKWMRKEFKRARNDGVKVIVMGHVPPTVKTFKDSCLDDYIKLSIKFEDIIMGHMYGHSNMDHFQVLSRGAIKNSLSVEKDHADMDITRDTGRFVSTLHDQYKKVKKVRDSEKLVVVHVAPPMLPLFFPTFRINEYEANRSSSHFGDWLQYTQWFTNLTYWNEARHPVTDKHLSPQFEIEYSTNETYGMTDLTSERWLDFAEELASKEDKKMWKTYLANMFVQTNNDWYGQSIDPPTGDMTWWDWFWSSIQQTIKNKFL